MAGFPDVPRIRGDTDDDASIHLYSHVGPARPISKRTYDNQIMDILNREPDARDENTHNLNAQFEAYAGKHQYWSDSDADTQVEDEPPQTKRKVRSKPPAAAPTPPRVDGRVAAFVAVFALVSALLFALRWSPAPSPSPSRTSDVNTRIDLVEQRVSALGEISSALDQQVDVISAKQTAFFAAVEGLDSSLRSLQQNLTFGGSHFASIHGEIADFRARLEAVELLAEDPASLELRLGQISQKLSALSSINVDLASIKSDIVHEFLQRLPEHVPVYIKDKKVHYLPEFSRYIYSLVDRYNSEGKWTLNWNDFLRENGHNLDEYMARLLQHSQVQLLTRSEFEAALQEKFAAYNDDILAKFNSLIDKIDLSGNLTHIDVAQSGSRVVLDNLLDFVSQGSLKINYAEYNLGARILGFLTSTGSAFNNRSLARRVFLGWYDYFSSSGIRAPKHMKYNANNILVDGGQYWQCESTRCSVGVRLSTPIILTDVILNNPAAGRPSDVSPPSTLAVYIKPRKRAHAQVLEEYLNYQTFMQPPSKNKYLAKFYKVQEVKLKGRSVEHIKLPVSIVNMKIPVRDMYVEIQAGGKTGIYNLRAYGLTEFNSMRYAEHFDSLLDDLAQQEAGRLRQHDALYRSPALGDDDYM